MSEDTSDFLPTRRSLLSRLKRCEDQSAWQAFFDTYWKLLYSVARKAGLTDAEAQDAVQETVIKVSKYIGQFRYNPKKCSFKTWLMLLTRQRIAMQFHKRRHSASNLDDGIDIAALQAVPDPAGMDMEAVWDAECERHLLATATESVKQQVKPEHYQMFHLYALQRWPVREVARALRVPVAQVYLVKHRVGRLFKKEIARLKLELT